MMRKEAKLFLNVLHSVRSAYDYNPNHCVMTNSTVLQAAFNSSFLQLFTEVLINPRTADSEQVASHVTEDVSPAGYFLQQIRSQQNRNNARPVIQTG